MIKAAILDDDPISRKIIQKYISKSANIEFVAEFDNPLTALEELPELNCDLVFLDMEMPEMTGLEFISAVKNIPQIVVISSKAEYAAETYNYDVSDYLVKPVEYSRFEQAVQKVEEISSSIRSGDEETDHIFIKKNKGFSRVRYNDINYIEALADYVQINSDSERFTVLSTMKAITERLPEKKFLRIHRSFIVAIDKIDRIDENMVIIGEHTIPVSRSYKDVLMKKLNLL